MNDSELERMAEQAEEARSVHSSMVAVTYVLLLAVFGVLLLLAGAMASAGVVP
jgi:CHASE3 domain sensor protein